MANTIQLHYTDTDQGDGLLPVILLHGYPLNSGIWREQQRALSGLYRVITPDLRGHGRTMAPTGVYDMDLMAADVLALLDSLRIDKFILLGHSMGGYISLAAWKMQRERILALGLIASQAGADTPDLRQGRMTTVEKVLNAAERGAKVVADQMLPRLFAEGLDPDPEVLEDVSKMILATDPTGIVGALKGMAARADSTDVLPEIDVPVLLLTGDKDQIIPSVRAETMSASIPNSTHIVVEDAGHLLMMEQPGATTESMRQFLNILKA